MVASGKSHAVRFLHVAVPVKTPPIESLVLCFCHLVVMSFFLLSPESPQTHCTEASDFTVEIRLGRHDEVKRMWLKEENEVNRELLNTVLYQRLS